MKWPFPNQTKPILFQIVTNHLLTIPADWEPFYPLQKGLVGKNFFREDLIPFRRSKQILEMNLFPTISFWYPLYYEFFASFTKMEDTMKQQDLLPLQVLPQPIPYDLLFEPFSNSSPSQKGRGRPPFARVLLLKAFIYKALRGIDTLTDLAFEFHNNPSIYKTLGFNLYKTPPSIERFSQFLRETPNHFLQGIRIHLV